MKKDYSEKSKLLQKIVLGIAVYCITVFVAFLFFSYIFKGSDYASLLPSSLAMFTAGFTSFFFLSPKERGYVFSDRRAVFHNKPFYIIYVFLLSFSMTVAINYLFQFIPWDMIKSENVVQDNDFFFSFPLGLQLAVYAFLVPIAEESLFRVLVFSRLREIIAFPAAALLTGVVFGVYHGNLMQGLYAFIMGTVMCFVMHYGGSVLYPILFHITANLISTLCAACSNINNVVYSPLVIIISFIYIVFAIILCFIFKNKLTKKDKQR